MTVWSWLAIALAGGVGAVARFVVDGAVGARFGARFPLGTLVINLSGSFMLGLLTGLELSTEALLIAGTAAIGSYTTFSTWMLDSDRLRRSGAPAAAALNVVVSVVLGVALAALGRTLGR